MSETADGAVADFSVSDHGSIVFVTPLTPEARGWLDDNVTGECMFYAGALVVEPRYLQSLVEGMVEGGLVRT